MQLKGLEMCVCSFEGKFSCRADNHGLSVANIDFLSHLHEMTFKCLCHLISESDKTPLD